MVVFLFDQPKEEGLFNTNQEMEDFLVANLEDFNSLIENRELCDEGAHWVSTSDPVPSMCLELKKKLNIVKITGTPDNQIMFTMYLNRKTASNEFYKGYLYTFSTLRDEWETKDTELDDLPDFNLCSSYYYAKRIENVETGSGWHIFTQRYCP